MRVRVRVRYCIRTVEILLAVDIQGRYLIERSGAAWSQFHPCFPVVVHFGGGCVGGFFGSKVLLVGEE